MRTDIESDGIQRFVVMIGLIDLVPYVAAHND